MTRGPFDGLQGGVAAALMCAEIEALAARDSLGFVAAFTAHFLKPVPLQELSVAIEPVRIGKRVSVVDAGLANASGQRCAIGRATLIAAMANDALPVPPAGNVVDPERLPLSPWPKPHDQPWLMDAMERRHGADDTMWFHRTRPIVGADGVMTVVLPAADFARGIWPPLGADKRVRAAIPNPDVTVHLLRAPRSPWIGLAAASAWSREGIGSGWARLHDPQGIIGHVTMSIAVTLLEG